MIEFTHRNKVNYSWLIDSIELACGAQARQYRNADELKEGVIDNVYNSGYNRITVNFQAGNQWLLYVDDYTITVVERSNDNKDLGTFGVDNDEDEFEDNFTAWLTHKALAMYN